MSGTTSGGKGVRAWVAAALLAAAATPVLASQTLAERDFAAALKTFQDGRRSEAFGRFIALANRGDVDAARIALFMHQYGPMLYGTHWDAGREDVEYWNTLVRNSSSASARAQPDFVPLAVVPAKGKVKVAARGKALAGVNGMQAEGSR